MYYLPVPAYTVAVELLATVQELSLRHWISFVQQSEIVSYTFKERSSVGVNESSTHFPLTLSGQYLVAVVKVVRITHKSLSIHPY